MPKSTRTIDLPDDGWKWEDGEMVVITLIATPGKDGKGELGIVWGDNVTLAKKTDEQVAKLAKSLATGYMQ